MDVVNTLGRIRTYFEFSRTLGDVGPVQLQMEKDLALISDSPNMKMLRFLDKEVRTRVRERLSEKQRNEFLNILSAKGLRFEDEDPSLIALELIKKGVITSEREFRLLLAFVEASITKSEQAEFVLQANQILAAFERKKVLKIYPNPTRKKTTLNR